MTWTVAVGDVLGYAYMLLGKTMFFSFLVQNTSVNTGGGASTLLNIKIPGGYVSTRYFLSTAVYIRDNAVRHLGYVTVAPGGTVITIVKEDETVFLNSAGFTGVFGQTCFEIA